MPTTSQTGRPVGQDDVLASCARDEEQQVASGRATETPFVVLGVVALGIAGAVALVVGLAFIVFWLS